MQGSLGVRARGYFDGHARFISSKQTEGNRPLETGTVNPRDGRAEAAAAWRAGPGVTFPLRTKEPKGRFDFQLLPPKFHRRSCFSLAAHHACPSSRIATHFYRSSVPTTLALLQCKHRDWLHSGRL